MFYFTCNHGIIPSTEQWRFEFVSELFSGHWMVPERQWIPDYWSSYMKATWTTSSLAEVDRIRRSSQAAERRRQRPGMNETVLYIFTRTRAGQSSQRQEQTGVEMWRLLVWFCGWFVPSCQCTLTHDTTNWRFSVVRGCAADLVNPRQEITTLNARYPSSTYFSGRSLTIHTQFLIWR